MSAARVVTTRFIGKRERHNGSGRPIAEGEVFWTKERPEGTLVPEGQTVVVSVARGEPPFFAVPREAVGLGG